MSLTSPSSYRYFITGSTITLSADASDPDGNLASVEFFRDGVSVAVISAGQDFIYELSNSASGEVNISVIATDTDGLQSTISEQTVNYSVDSDADGMPDAFELAIIAASQADSDPNNDLFTVEEVLPEANFDADEETNLSEALNGTDGTDPESNSGISELAQLLNFAVIDMGTTTESGYPFAVNNKGHVLSESSTSFIRHYFGEKKVISKRTDTTDGYEIKIKSDVMNNNGIVAMSKVPVAHGTSFPVSLENTNGLTCTSTSWVRYEMTPAILNEDGTVTDDLTMPYLPPFTEGNPAMMPGIWEVVSCADDGSLLATVRDQFGEYVPGTSIESTFPFSNFGAEVLVLYDSLGNAEILNPCNFQSMPSTAVNPCATEYRAWGDAGGNVVPIMNNNLTISGEVSHQLKYSGRALIGPGDPEEFVDIHYFIEEATEEPPITSFGATTLSRQPVKINDDGIVMMREGSPLTSCLLYTSDAADD